MGFAAIWVRRPSRSTGIRFVSWANDQPEHLVEAQGAGSRALPLRMKKWFVSDSRKAFLEC
jgi:hypothetical protein